MTERRRPARRRRGRPSTYERRTTALARLFYRITDEESRLMPGQRSGADDEARAVLADALEEQGVGKLAIELRRWPRGRRFSGSFLHQKIRHAIFGPTPRHETSPRKPEVNVLLANVGTGWEKVDDFHIADPDGSDYVFYALIGYSALRLLVRANDLADAQEAAEERWPHLMLDEIDDEAEADERMAMPHPTKPDVWVVADENVAVRRARVVRGGRRLDRYGHEAYVPGYGIVEFR